MESQIIYAVFVLLVLYAIIYMIHDCILVYNPIEIKYNSDMKNMVSYKMEIKDEYRSFYDTLSIYQKAVEFLISVVDDNYDAIVLLGKECFKQKAIENLVHTTRINEAKYPSFDEKFHKFPSYFRRAAINAVLGAVSSYRSNLKLWEESGRKTKKPRLKINRNVMPVFYKGNTFCLAPDGSSYDCNIKLFIRNDWIYKSFRLRKTDLDYLKKRGLELKDAMSPSLRKKGKRFEIVLSFKTDVELVKTKKRILSCDIGVNNAAVCSVMEEDGTVLERRFITFPVEEDRFNTILNQIRRAHSDSPCMTHRLYRYADNYNEALSMKTASSIVAMAVEFQCDVIVMENLKGKKGKIHGSKAMRLSLWRKRDIEERVERLAHSHGMRFSTVCAWNTSRLAYDGSGAVTRDSHNHSLCTFTTGKKYKCDLSASYNIGARYFAREIWKSLPEKAASTLKAKVPELWYGAQCTLSTLRDLYAVKDELPELSSDCSGRSVFPAF